MEWISAQLPSTGTTQWSFKPSTGTTRKRNNLLLCLQLLLSSKWFYHFYHITLHISAPCNTRMCSPFKTVLGKIGDTYQAYCNTYKMHAMATCHRGTGCPLNSDIDLNREDLTPMYIDNDHMHSFNVTVALHKPRETAHPKDPEYNNDAQLMALTREIDDLHQWVQDGEGQPMETLNCIECKLQETLYNTSSTSTHRTLWRNDMALHKHFVCHTITIQSDNLLTIGYLCLWWPWHHKPRRLANGHRNSSRSDKWKQSQAC